MNEQVELRKEFAEWVSLLKRNGFRDLEVKCEECNGSGETECPHCGRGEVECEECDGEGTIEFPTFWHYIRFKSAEKELLELWKNGEPLTIQNRTMPKGFEELFRFLHSEQKQEQSLLKVIVEVTA